MNIVLTIAGSDSGGGAGIQADLKTFTVLGCYGMSVITALTAQNTMGVQGIHPVEPPFVSQQLQSVTEDFSFTYIKSGMLFSKPIIQVLSHYMKKHPDKRLILDPVMISKSGSRLLQEEAVISLKNDLLPECFLITPNIPEAEVLTGLTIHKKEDFSRAVQALHRLGAENVVLKGGHYQDKNSFDVFSDGKKEVWLEYKKSTNPHTHGTGCTFSAAITSYLALNNSLEESVRKARQFISNAIQYAVPLGKGISPTNHIAAGNIPLEKGILRQELLDAFEYLRKHHIAPLIPEIQSNLCACKRMPETVDDTMAFPGRIVRFKDSVRYVALPEYGASKHMGKVLLTVSKADKNKTAVMNIRYFPQIVDIADKLGLSIASFDRSLEPQEVKEKEGSSLEWGTREVIRQKGYVPDIIYDLGEVGKEPVSRIIGTSALQVAQIVGKIYEEYKKNA